MVRLFTSRTVDSELFQGLQGAEMMTNAKIVCVLGMARSGTFLTSMILTRLGVYFGPKEYLPEPYRYNQKGSWEHRFIKKINQKIFSQFGGNWQSPPVFAPGWENASELKNLREEARIVIQQDFGNAEIWGYKCILTCLTLPFWQQLLPTMQYVICLRHPMDVALSLERRDGFSLEKGFYLWLLYTYFALKHTVGHSRILIYSENWINGWQDEIQRLADFLGKPVVPDEVTQAIIDERLWHHSTSAKALSEVLRVYDAFTQNEPFQSNGSNQMLQEALKIVRPEAQKQENRKQRNQYEQWMEQLRLATQELDALIPTGDSLILVDEGQWASKVLANYRTIPFIEYKGHYWGSPPDDATAIHEFERLRRMGANFIVFGWPAFWWLDYYIELNRYLRSSFRCVLQNERIVVFDLRS